MRMSLSARGRRHGSPPKRGGMLRFWPWLTWAVSVLLLVTPFAGLVTPRQVTAHHTSIKFPFASGATWNISQGYDTSAAAGGSHYDCDPVTNTDALTHTVSCSDQWQYKFSFDLVRADGNTSGQPVISPVTGTIRWIDTYYGGMSINLGDGYALAYFHTVLASGLAAGQTIQQGQYLGTVAPPGGGGNGGFPHLHITLWRTNDGGNWDRHGVPFTDDHMIDGYDFPYISSTTRNQYRGRQVVSTNQATGGATSPVAPTLVSPATGTSYPNAGVSPTLRWNGVSGATQYQVVVNDGAIKSGWISGTQWTMPALNAGQYAWQVQARNSTGTGPLSAKWVFFVSSNNLTPTPGPTIPPSDTTSISLDAYSGGVGKGVYVTGTGYNANEQVGIYWESTSSTALKTVTASSNGTWSTTVTIPEAVGGGHLIVAKGLTSGKKASRTFTITPTLARVPYQGPPGTAIVVTVQGFKAGEQVKLTFDSASGPTLGTATTNTKGTGNVNITMPSATTGWHDYTGLGLTSNTRAWGALLVQPAVSVSPTIGAAGTSVSVSAKGFPGASSATVAWNKTSTNAGTQVCSGTTASNGNYSCTFAIPQSGSGTFPLVVSAGGQTASTTVSVSGPPSVSVAPSSGMAGTDLSVSIGGFGANENVNLSWDSNTTVWRQVKADGNGAYLLKTTFPNISVASHTLKARGVTTGRTASKTLSVTSSGPGTSMVGPGTFLITGTREGLVGGTTSSGHVIVPDDHFVSLPACTASSCPWTTPGSVHPTYGYIANCGTNCYVRVTNPTTGKCSVGKVLDVGPWHTNDNWWDAASRRNLNNLDTTLNYLAQGYTGADAARNGLDIGYGLSGGIGISNKGYAVGNRAAIDLGDGTWRDIGYADGAGPMPIKVSMLWMSGESHTTAAAACDGTATTDAKISLNKTTTHVGSDVVVTGSGFKAGESVGIYWDSSSSTALTSLTADSAGNFTKTIKAPHTVGGKHLVVAKGMTSGRKASRSITITPSLSRTPTSGPVGATISITGRGFGASESVQVRLDSTSGMLLRTLQTNSVGTGSSSFAIPSGVCQGLHKIVAKGLTTGLQVSSTLSITSGPTCTTASVSPQSATPSSKVTIKASGYAANERIRIYWDGSTSSSSSGWANAYGAASFQITVPTTYGGAHTIVARGDSSGRSVSIPFTVTQKLTTSPRSGVGGTVISATGKGWKAGATVYVYWNRTSTSTGSRVCTTTVLSTGTFNCSFLAKNWQVGKDYPLVAISGSLTATSWFLLTGLASGQVSASPTPTATPTGTASPEASPVPSEPTEAPVSPTPTETGQTPTEQPTEIPTEVPTEVPTAVPTETPTPEPAPRELVFNPIADTSVSVPMEGTPQPADPITVLAAGGQQQAFAYLTFSVAGVAPGTVVDAKLIVTGAAYPGGPGGTVKVVPGAIVDEASWSYQTVNANDQPVALKADGAASTLDWLEPGVETTIDVTGTVAADGTVTFAIVGTPGQIIGIASRESGTPPRLVVTVVDG